MSPFSLAIENEKTFGDSTSWWFQPSGNYARQYGSFPQNSGEHKKSLKPPPSVSTEKKINLFQRKVPRPDLAANQPASPQ